MFDPLPAPSGRTSPWAFGRYEAVRNRLPEATFDVTPVFAEHLEDVADRFDGFVLDAFGVLNIGDTAVPDAPERMAALRAMGKRMVVLTNGATQPHAAAVEKYRRFGFDFSYEEVVSSREIAADHLDDVAPGAVWGAACGPTDTFEDIDADVADLMADENLYARADAFLFLSSARWGPDHQARLARALADNPRPLVVANPDLVAPFETSLSLEPGAYAHALADQGLVEPRFFGKPFQEAFQVAAERLGAPRERIAMVGDTLHTDVLGGRKAGFATILVTDHGLFKGRDANAYVAESGIRPDYIIPTT